MLLGTTSIVHFSKRYVTFRTCDQIHCRVDNMQCSGGMRENTTQAKRSNHFDNFHHMDIVKDNDVVDVAIGTFHP